jgi:2-polyprenyl-3-methyl-5-hydroxy-6-metoxy-1,4-benzoquinol methylase
MATAIVEETKGAPEFLSRLIEILNDGMLCLAISVGHRTGLFDTMADGAKATSADIAKRAGLNERYVREWLGAMVTGRIVDYEPRTKTYTLPPERSIFITRAAGIDNLATQAQYVALLGTVESRIVESFRRGGGVPYSEFTDFQRLMAEESAQTLDARLLQTTLPLVDGLMDRLRSGIDIADIGCGSGHAINLMAEAFPKSRFIGYDFSEEGLAAGKAEAKERKLANVRFESKDVSTLESVAAFDFITSFDAIHDQAQPDRVLAGIRRALRPGGVYLCVDIAASSDLEKNLEHPLGPLLYTVSTMHCMTVSLALGGKGLGTVWGKELTLSMLVDAGFGRVDVKQVDGDILNNYYIAYPK